MFMITVLSSGCIIAEERIVSFAGRLFGLQNVSVKKRHREGGIDWEAVYDPNMPKSIPIVLFLVRLFRRLRRLTVRWFRTGLALFLWLGWLPWVTQCAWKFSFKLGDSLVVKPLFADTTRDSQTTWLQYVLRRGDISLRSLFKYKTINKIMIDVLEGQLITGIIVIIFIIILLCREWVMGISLNNDHHFESAGFDINSYTDPLGEQRMIEQTLNEIPSDNIDDDADQSVSANEQDHESCIASVHSEEIPTHIARPLKMTFGPEELKLDDDDDDDDIVFNKRDEIFFEGSDDNLSQSTSGSPDLKMIHQGMSRHRETLIETGLSRPRYTDEQNRASFEDSSASLHMEFINVPVEDAHMDRRNINFAGVAESLSQNGSGYVATQNVVQRASDGSIVRVLSARMRSFWGFTEENIENREHATDEADQETLLNMDRASSGTSNANVNQENDDLPDELGEIDGIIELSGIRGPIVGLFQNCIVTSILIAIFLGLLVLVPYVLGKSVILITVRIPHYLIQFPESTIQKIFLSIVDAVVFFIFQSHAIMKSIANSALSRIMQRITSIYLSGSSSALDKEVIFYVYGVKIVIPPRIMTLGTRNTVFDRTVSIIIGYCILITTGALYLKKHSSLKRRSRQGVIHRVMNDTLQQASLIIKFVIIVGIEVIIFPIYCGILIDLSLLDLFENASINTRLAFTNSNPFISYFLHWFIGTAYMFQFALFVKMCRDIVRPGVLFFIHDPNDAQFHPIKEILERPIKLQLRKIFTSGIIYSCLICSCFLSVVYSAKYFFPNLFPLHLSINTFLFGIPFDILALHILIPLTLKLIKPAVITKALWLWWLKTISAKLRLTSFMFNGRHPQEEGTYVRKSLMAKLLIKKLDVSDNSQESLKNLDVVFVRNGSFLRVPFKDNIPLHRESMFIPVTEDNVRLDKKQDNGTKDSPNFTVVYVPPSFIKRIVVFLFLVWIFAFLIGVMLTIPPCMLLMY
ncbi:unnamed protein product [Pneumocystis jirovecii]|uniref:RING-type E3 ubiquitin transferase n=1 Tax=Pneumocystis jirovecii TaxID=42068 RepID=L0PA22_PNEJI|nr:unnamed protein product [Pneumocystis jirovecii]